MAATPDSKATRARGGWHALLKTYKPSDPKVREWYRDYNERLGRLVLAEYEDKSVFWRRG